MRRHLSHKRTGRLRIAVASVVVVIASFVTLFSQGGFFRDKSAVFASEMKTIEACLKRADAIMCTLPSIQHMLDVANATEIMGKLEENLEPMACHYVGHVVGQQLYVRGKSTERALEQCNRMCDSACIHGVIGESFAEESGLGDPSDIEHADFGRLSATELRRIGSRLCRSSEACHGVGHTIFQSVKDLEKSMALCRVAAPANNIIPCYNGASMEYADILMSRNMRPIDGVRSPTMEMLPTFCLLGSQAEKRACFRYFPRVVQATMEPLGFSPEDGQDETRRICLTYSPGDDRIACIAGIGTFFSYLIHTDQAEARKECYGFENRQDRASCTLGEVFVAVGDRKEKLADFCASQPDQIIKKSCFQELFHFLNFVGVATESTENLCNSHGAVCEEGRKDYASDSWEIIKKM